MLQFELSSYTLIIISILVRQHELSKLTWDEPYCLQYRSRLFKQIYYGSGTRLGLSMIQEFRVISQFSFILQAILGFARIVLCANGLYLMVSIKLSLSGTEFVPPPWQFFANAGIGIGIIVAIVTATYKITRAYGRVEERIGLLERQLHLIEEHAIFALFNAWQRTKGAAAFFDDTLRSREEQGEREG